MKKNDYNGWSNRETWLVNLWLSSDDLINKSADYIQGYVETFVNPEGSGLAVDLLNGAIAKINWRELEESYRSL